MINKKFNFSLLFTGLTMMACGPAADTSEETDKNEPSGTHTFVVNATSPIAQIQPTMYGVFFEDINFAADGGLYAEMVKNRSFEFSSSPKIGWLEPNTDNHSMNEGSGRLSVIQEGNETNAHFARIVVKNAEGYALINEGFRAMGIKSGDRYNLNFDARVMSGNISEVTFTFVNSENNQTYGGTTVSVSGNTWSAYSAEFTATETVEKAHLRITFNGTGEVDLDMISLFPEDTWKGRKNGLRKDIVQLLDDLNPGFLRFPGGCIVEGSTLDRRYQWKKTVGPISDRDNLINRWNEEFAHRPTPDYYQSFGLGFFEYFQLSEDLGAEPLPILSCGIACQFNTGELVPMDELDPYVDDALDLIEFANGPVTSEWGKVRNDMGHPEPFNLKYIGIGNEQWGEVYIERYKVFEKAVKSKYPEMIIISGSGPFPDGEHFDYGMAELKKLGAEIIDEHYYRAPEWFRENADRYDSYDREGPKIFAGEYAAQSVAIASPDNKNNWNCALSEAAYMTGMERNAEVVTMTCYAPLMAHAEAWQWTPDMIWFNNLESYGTANYYIQKMYSTNAGTEVLSLTANGTPVIGKDGLYASAARDSSTGEMILKIANVGKVAQNINIELQGNQAEGSAKIFSMHGNDLEAVNSFEEPKKLSPEESSMEVSGQEVNLEIGASTFKVIRFKTNS